jgi:hypothetical protein
MSTNKRRIFLQDESGNGYQLFSFEQVKDGSVYCSWPEFQNTKWMSIENTSPPKLIVVDPIAGRGKLSIHGSGRQHFTIIDTQAGHQMIKWGNNLLDEKNGKIGTRHLLTIFSQKPDCIPDSPPLKRANDVILKTKEIKPFSMIFFAVPGIKKLTVEINGRFHVDDIEIPPPSGWGAFGLRQHNIVWFYYRTKHMDEWPRHTHVCYHNGFHVPLFIAMNGKKSETKEGECRLEIRSPTYSLAADSLSISI